MLREGLTAIDVFVSYSHRDEELRKELDAHLTALKKQGLLRAWNDRDISAGTSWREEIDRNLNSAHVVLLLVSPAFLASEYCWDQEMLRALERHRAGEARVIPIILRPCDWHHSPLGELQALPRDGHPITRWPDRDEAFVEVVRGIRRVVEQLRAAAKPPAEPTQSRQPVVVVDEWVAAKPPRKKEHRPGEERVNAIDGSVLLYVPAGKYTLGAADITSDEQPVHQVELSAFWLGKFAVTNGQYGKFLSANPQHAQPLFWKDPRFNDSRQPVVGVSWADAHAYCQWAGLALPTEAQWEAAARGKDQRPYPWGDEEPTEHHARFDLDLEQGKPAPVGSFLRGAGPFGTLDQAGNVWEWCRDLWVKDAYRDRGGKADPCASGDEHDESAWRVVRGGSWVNRSRLLRAAIRSRGRARDRDLVVGFRVAAGGGSEHND